MSDRRTRYYSSFTDDFEHSAEQDYRLPDNYRWVRTDIRSRILSAVIYGAAVAISAVYCRLILHMRIKGREKLRVLKDGYFIYGNHTQPVGDVFIPAHAAFPRRIYTVVSPANYGLPVIGRILPYLGALPVSDDLSGMKKLQQAIDLRVGLGHPIVIYPEAHVWEYYTGIRPYPDASFKYPARIDKPAVAMTTVYNRSRIFRRPRMTVYIDGPFYPSGDSVREKASSLHDKVYSAMTERARLSDCEYIEYRPKSE